MTPQQRQRFDELMEEAIEKLPPSLADLIEEVPVIVLDRPTPDMLRSIGIDPGDSKAAGELCGLHTGTAFTEASVERPELSSNIHLFRDGIVDLAGGWDQPDADDAIYEEIMVTLLHEIGHQFGLDEDDLERLGYD